MKSNLVRCIAISNSSTTVWNHPPALAVHRDFDAVILEAVCKFKARKLRALIGVENFRLAMAGKGFLERLHAKPRVHRIGEPPGEHFAAIPVHNRHQIQKSPPHRNIRDVGAPDMVGP